MPTIPWDLLMQLNATAQSLEYPGSWFDETMEPYLEQIASVIMYELERRQPYGKDAYAGTGGVEPHYNKLPSQRFGHTPISEGWRSTVFCSGWQEGDHGGHVEIYSKSEHVEAVLTGQLKPFYEEPHDPRRFCYFWWGDPLPWPAKDGEPPGFRFFSRVERKERKANPFLAESVQATKDRIRYLVTFGIERWLIEEHTRRNMEHVER